MRAKTLIAATKNKSRSEHETELPVRQHSDMKEVYTPVGDVASTTTKQKETESRSSRESQTFMLSLRHFERSSA